MIADFLGSPFKAT